MPQPATLTTETARDRMRARQPIGHDVDCVNNTEDHNTDQDSACISVDLLGGLRVRAGQTTMGPRDLGGTKLRRVLLALLLHRGSPVSKERLVSMLWEGSPPSGAKATLESYVCVLRKKLNPSQAARTSLITTVAGCYAIDMSRVDLDLVRYDRLLAAALRTDTSAKDALPMLQQAMALAESPLLPEEVDCEWLDDMRRAHAQSARKDLIAAANKVAGLPSGGAERWARLALEGDALDESAWHALLQSMEASGQHADGLQAYDQCRRLFASELGCAPGPGLQALYVRLLRGANENNDELSLLFDAVVRLHTASKQVARPPVRALGGERLDANDQVGSVEQACQALDLLMRKVSGRRSHLAVAVGA